VAEGAAAGVCRLTTLSLAAELNDCFRDGLVAYAKVATDGRVAQAEAMQVHGLARDA